MNERTSGALSLMPSGNLEGSWYYYLLINNQVVKRNKATPIPITDDIISFMNNKSIDRKGKFNKPDIPQFERGISSLLNFPFLPIDLLFIKDIISSVIGMGVALFLLTT